MSTDDKPARTLRIVAPYHIITDPVTGKETKHKQGTELPESAWATSPRHLATMIRVGDLAVVNRDPPEPPAEVIALPGTEGAPPIHVYRRVSGALTYNAPPPVEEPPR